MNYPPPGHSGLAPERKKGFRGKKPPMREALIIVLEVGATG